MASDNFQSAFSSLGFPGGSVVKNPPANAGDAGSIPGSRRSLEEGNSNPLQYSCLGNPMDRRAWQATVREVWRAGCLRWLLHVHLWCLSWDAGRAGGCPAMSLFVHTLHVASWGILTAWSVVRLLTGCLAFPRASIQQAWVEVTRFFVT